MRTKLSSLVKDFEAHGEKVGARKCPATDWLKEQSGRPVAEVRQELLADPLLGPPTAADVIAGAQGSLERERADEVQRVYVEGLLAHPWNVSGVYIIKLLRKDAEKLAADVLDLLIERAKLNLRNPDVFFARGEAAARIAAARVAQS